MTATPINISRQTAGLVCAMGVPGFGSVSIASPAQYQMFQRSGTAGSIPLSGTCSGVNSGGIQARFNGGSWQTVVAGPVADGAWSGSLTGQTVGQGLVEVRLIDSPSTIASVATVGIGDIYLTIGDSNHSGRATTSVVQPSSTDGFTSVVWSRGDEWVQHTESITNTGSYDEPYGQGSYFGALAQRIMDGAHVPVGFVTGAQGSTTLDDWSDTSNGTNPFWVYGRALTQANGAGGYGNFKALLCLLGTNPSSLDTAGSTTAYTNIVDAYAASLGCPTLLYYAVNASAANNEAVAAVVSGNANALQGPDFVGAWTGDIHYLNSTQINEAADRAWSALQTLFYS